MMLSKYCIQYVSKCGKLSSGHRTGKCQFSFQSQRRAMSNNVKTTVLLHSFQMQERWCSKSFKLGFRSMWTKNFQMYKLGLEKAEEPEIKLSTLRKQGSSRKTSPSLIMLKPLTVSVQFSCSVMSNSLHPMNCNRPGLPVHHQLLEPTQTHVHWLC